MKAMEEQNEEKARYLHCNAELEGNAYEFAFGLNWFGITNYKIEKYK